jgi:hypothetical protein
MGMYGIWAAKSDDFAITVHRGSLIFATMMSDMTLHQPRLGMLRINLQDTIDKDFRNFPPFFGNCTRRV